MNKAAILLLFASIMLFGSSSCTRPRGQKQPAAEEETKSSRYYVVDGWQGRDYKIVKHLISNVISVNCPPDHGEDNVKEQYADWYRSKYGDGFHNNQMVETSFSTYEAASYEEAVKYRNNVLEAIREQREPVEELKDEEFRYICNDPAK